MSAHKKLFRSADDRMLGGVAGGLADYLGVTPLITRILFIALVIFGGSGILVYLLLWMIIPRDPLPELSMDDTGRSRAGFPVFLKATGVALLLALAVTWATGISFLIPFVIGMGLGLYYFGRGSEEGMSLAERFELYRSSDDRKILGVFGGLAERFEMDPTVMRVIGVASIFLTSGAAIPLYFLYALLIPREEQGVERIIIV